MTKRQELGWRALLKGNWGGEGGGGRRGLKVRLPVYDCTHSYNLHQLQIEREVDGVYQQITGPPPSISLHFSWFRFIHVSSRTQHEGILSTHTHTHTHTHTNIPSGLYFSVKTAQQSIIEVSNVVTFKTWGIETAFSFHSLPPELRSWGFVQNSSQILPGPLEFAPARAYRVGTDASC